MQARTIICGMIALAVLPGPAPAGSPDAPLSVCHLTDGGDSALPPTPLPPDSLPPARQATLDLLCDALRTALQAAKSPPPGTALYLQLVATSPTGMTLRLLQRDTRGQETSGRPLTIDTVDGPAPSGHSLRQMARLLIATLPPA